MKKEIKSNLKSLTILSSLITILFLMGFIGMTYSYYKARIEGSTNPFEGNLKNIAIQFSDTDEINVENIIPGWEYTKTITLTNNNSETARYTLKFIDLINTFETGYLKYSITSPDGGCNISEKSVPFIHAEPIETVICNGVSINASAIHTYEINFKYVETEEPDFNYGPDQGKTFSTKIGIGREIQWYEDCTNNPNMVGCKIITDNTIKTNADFTKTSLELNQYGVYLTAEIGKNIYYYRGGDHCQNSDGTVNSTYTTKEACEGASLTWYTLNNNIIFAGKCWQIIRTNEDGSTRIIYNGVPTGGKCNATGSGTHVGTSAFNGTTRTIGSKTYSIYTDTSSVGYTFGSPEDGTYQVYKGAGVVTADVTVAYGQTIGTGYTLDSSTGYFTLTGTSTVSGSTAPNGTTNKYYCSGGTATCIYMYEVTNDAVVTHNQISSNYIINKTYRIGANWSKSEAKATANELDSTMKTYLENWYENNMLSHSDFIEDAGYCNDRSLTNSTLGYGSSGYYGAYGRLASNKAPSNECPNSTRDLYTVNNSKGNNNAKYPIGLITADEAVYGGLKYGTEMNINSYLYTGQYYWTFSPFIFYPSYSFALEWFVFSSGNFSGSNVNNAYGVRPVVSLKSNVQVTGGVGSKDSPYIIE